VRNHPLRHLLAVPIILLLVLNPIALAAFQLAGWTFGRPLIWLLGALILLYGAHLILMQARPRRPWSGWAVMAAVTAVWITCDIGPLGVQVLGLAGLFFFARAFMIRDGSGWPRDAAFTLMGVMAAVFLYPIGLAPALAAFLLVQTIHDMGTKAAGPWVRDVFRDNLKSAERVLEQMGL
jgi:hypothetical protein